METNKETPIAIGTRNTGNPVIVFGSEDGKTWTIVEPQDGQIACIRAAGTDWKRLAFPGPDA
jgi:hypothetical protein